MDPSGILTTDAKYPERHWFVQDMQLRDNAQPIVDSSMDLYPYCCRIGSQHAEQRIKNGELVFYFDYEQILVDIIASDDTRDAHRILALGVLSVAYESKTKRFEPGTLAMCIARGSDENPPWVTWMLCED